ncbi:small subunit ribosomal protein S20 [Nitrosomonas marina]|uniref:Small ribosomal subunit protein bS20 n=1 Tax=Nitrosomonas marina TaxID=917 RepID=A0A1I0EQ20_9PROT|nr:30S ribosomal protein S20 [Nitrosomonas marina]SET47626.1 small subunit ribosomal protein S20 [Nitrosomonas marina]
MANSAQARKRARQSVKRREHNVSMRSRLRTAIKQVKKLIETGEKEKANAAFIQTVSTVDTIAGKGIIHKNKAARQKSRLSAALKEMT